MDSLERLLHWIGSVKVLVGLIVGAFLAGGGSYVAWGAVAKKATVDAALVEQKNVTDDLEKAHIQEAAKLEALSNDIAGVKDDVRHVRDIVESWARPPTRR